MVEKREGCYRLNDLEKARKRVPGHKGRENLAKTSRWVEAWDVRVRRSPMVKNGGARKGVKGKEGRANTKWKKKKSGRGGDWGKKGPSGIQREGNSCCNSEVNPPKK